jgi:hypothetical protein
MVVQVLFEHRPELPVVAMSGFGAHLGHVPHIRGFLSKPFTIDELTSAVVPLLGAAGLRRRVAPEPSDEKTARIDLVAAAHGLRARKSAGSGASIRGPGR